MNLLTIVKNKILLYLVSRYVTYFIEFITSLIIAAKLGPFYFGVWGSILLLLNYFQQLHFGIANSTNVLLVHNIQEKEKCNKYISNSILLVGTIAMAVAMAFWCLTLTDLSFVKKYGLDGYVLIICLISFLQYFRMLFINIFRVFNKLNYIIVAQSIIVLLNFLAVLLFEGETLIYTLVLGYLLGNFVCFVLAFFSPVIPRVSLRQFSTAIQKEIMKKGIFLFLYNSCFYFILISIRTIISGNYRIEEFGIFTFSYTLANAMLLLLDAVSFVFFPKLIDKLSSDDINEVERTKSAIQNSYVVSAHFLVYSAILLYPVLLMFLPKYEGSEVSFNLVSITVLINTSSFVYASYLIARNMEKTAAIISMAALVMNACLGMVLAVVVRVDYYFVIFATMVAYIVFTLSVAFKAISSLKTVRFIDVIGEVFPAKISIPVILSICATLSGIYYFNIIPFVVFLFMNRKEVSYMVSVIVNIIRNPSFADLKK